LKNARGGVDQLLRDRRPEERRGQVIDVMDGSGRQLPAFTELQDQLAYAQRAATYAFSTPGREMRAGLRDQERKFIRLEGRDGEVELLGRLGGPPKYR
jgi:hypothetical protein